MAGKHRVRTQQILREAEGYIELGMPEHALKALDRLTDPGTFRGFQCYLRGEALRSLGRYNEAVEPLRDASEISPSNMHVWLALGWCYKRNGRLDLAIESLQRAYEIDARHAIISYNLACYLSLAGKRDRSLEFLSKAIGLEPRYREEAGEEPDFDSIRNDPDFRALTRGMMA